MKPFLVLYATREGQTRKIAEHVATTLRGVGYETDVIDAADAPRDVFNSEYAGAVVLASVHRGRHENEMSVFVKGHVADLERISVAFLSVSLSEAGAEDLTALSPAERKQQPTLSE